MSQDPTSAYINYLLSQNCYTETKCDELMSMVHSLELNVSHLNSFIQSTYDLCMNSANCAHITTHDSMGNVLSCVNYDSSGNFILCDMDASGNFLPCVLPPMNETMQRGVDCSVNLLPFVLPPHIMYRGMEMPPPLPPKKPTTKSRGYPYPYPYPRPSYPYYPYYPYYKSYYDSYYSSTYPYY